MFSIRITCTNVSVQILFDDTAGVAAPARSLCGCQWEQLRGIERVEGIASYVELTEDMYRQQSDPAKRSKLLELLRSLHDIAPIAIQHDVCQMILLFVIISLFR